MATSSSPITPTPSRGFPSPAVPAVSFDVREAVKRQNEPAPLLTDEQFAFCKDALIRLKEKMVSVESRMQADKEFDALMSGKLVAYGEFTKMHAARLPENQSKNRYDNVVPFDSTRVRLNSNNELNILGDYINASYIMDTVHENLPVFIATQEPLKSTIIDLWQMVVQQKCPVIVMLTQLVDGKERYASYYPTRLNQSELYGQLRVTTKAVNYLQNHIIQRIIEVQNVKDSEASQHTLIHLEYLGWPDSGVPSSTAPVRQMIQCLRCIPSNAGPRVVHCSAGIGRTGTFCAIDHSIRRILSGDVTALDIGQTVKNFRSQRFGMVQTRVQYRFIYEAVIDEIQECVNRRRQCWNRKDWYILCHRPFNKRKFFW